MYERHEREKYKMADSMWFILYTFHKQSYFFWLVHVENENSGKYMRLRANLCVWPLGGWVGDGTFDMCCFFWREKRHEKQENQWIYVLCVAEEINETLKRKTQRKLRKSFFTGFRSILVSRTIFFANAHKSKRHDRQKYKEKKWWRLMKWNLYVSLFYFQNPLNT